MDRKREEYKYMARKKMNFKIPKLVKNIIEQDAEHFGISKERLCNLIFEKLAFEENKIDMSKYLKSEETSRIYFNINVKNSICYQEVLEYNNVEIEADFFRIIFSMYANMNPSIRERIIFEDLYKKIFEVINNRNSMRINYKNKCYLVKPCEILTCNVTSYTKVKLKVNKLEQIWLAKIEFIKEVNEN